MIKEPDKCFDCGKTFGKTTTQTGYTKDHERDYFRATVRNIDFTPLEIPQGHYGCGHKQQFTKKPRDQYNIVRANTRLEKKKQNELRGKTVNWLELWYDYPVLKSLFYHNFSKFKQYAICMGYVSSDRNRMKKQVKDLIRARMVELEWVT